MSMNRSMDPAVSADITTADAAGEAMVRDSVGAIAPRGGDFKRIRALRFRQPGIDTASWRTAADMGWLALRLPEDDGGPGLGMRGYCALAGELGAALVPEPVIAVAAIVPLLPREWRERVLSGSAIVLPAWQERAGRPAAEPATSLSRQRVTGRKVLVPMAGAADAFLVTTRGGLALVESNAAGVVRTFTPMQDGGHFGTLDFQDAAAEPVAGTIAQALDELTLAHAGYLFGAAEWAFSITLDYLRLRKQFGKYIGAFQALQHRAVNIKIQIELCRAVLSEATAAADAGAPGEVRIKAASRAIARIADTAILVAREAVQMHGAIGTTDEHDISLFCRKLLSLYNLYGSADWHRSRYLRLAEAAQ
jgi:alkylation response protein AidB-like acyl-CoA dehydrogenase